MLDADIQYQLIRNATVLTIWSTIVSVSQLFPARRVPPFRRLLTNRLGHAAFHPIFLWRVDIDGHPTEHVLLGI